MAVVVISPATKGPPDISTAGIRTELADAIGNLVLLDEVLKADAHHIPNGDNISDHRTGLTARNGIHMALIDDLGN